MLPEKCRIHVCMCGSKRRKSTAFLMNFFVENLMQECQSSTMQRLMCKMEQAGNFLLAWRRSPSSLPWLFWSACNIRGNSCNSPTFKETNARICAGTQPSGRRSAGAHGRILLQDWRDLLWRDAKLHWRQCPTTFPRDPGWRQLMSSRNLSEVGNDGKKTLGQKNTHGVPFSRAEFLQKLLNSNTHWIHHSLLTGVTCMQFVFQRDHTVAEVKLFGVIKVFLARLFLVFRSLGRCQSQISSQPN